MFTLFHIVIRSIFSQIKKLNFVYCWCFDMFYYPTFFIHQNLPTDLTCMWVQFKLKHFVLNHEKNWQRGRNTFLGFCDSNETLIFMSKFSMKAFLKNIMNLFSKERKCTSFHSMSQKDQKFWRKLTFDISKFKFQNGLEKKTSKCWAFFQTNRSVGAKPQNKVC